VDGLVHISLERIERSRFQPRRVFDEVSIRGLAESIRASGLMQPVIVRPRSESGGGFELIAGERRWRAAKEAGLREIPAIVRELSDRDAAQWALVENVQREDLNAMERAWAFRSLCDNFGLTQAQVAERVGLDRASVANAVRLTELEEPIRAMIESGLLAGGHGKALLSMAAGPARVKLAQRASKEAWSVRQLEREASGAVVGGRAGAVGAESPSDRGEAALLAAASRVALEKQLGEHLGTRVSLAGGGGVAGKGAKGRLVIEFYGLDHFDGLLAKMGFRMA
jgi:ParB family chromosome partitioning protein